jgi:drug/metabolite transporter (DMT)-like permease
MGAARGGNDSPESDVGLTTAVTATVTSHVVHEVGVLRRPSPIWIFLAMAFLILVWSLNYVVAKIGLRELPPLALASFRIVTAGIVSLPVLFLPRAGKRVESKVMLEVLEKRPKASGELWAVAYLGFFNVVVNQGCYTVGLNYTSVSHSSLIIGCAPILILLLSWAMRVEALTRLKALGMALAFAGAAVVAVEQAGSTGRGTGLGDALTLLAGVGFALYTVLGKQAIEEYGAVRTSLLSNIAGAVMMLPVALWQIHALARVGRLGSVGAMGWEAVIYMGVLASALSYVLYFWALRYMTPARLGAVTYLQPVGATLLGLILIGEPITRRVAFGGLLIIAGVYAIESHAQEPQAKLA